MSTLTSIREKELEREIKKRRRILLEKQHENFISAVKKMRNASNQQGEASKVKMSSSEKKKMRNWNTSNKIFGEHIRHFFP